MNPRSPAAGFPSERGSGIAFEHMVALANAADKDLWVCIRHLATEDFIRTSISGFTDGYQIFTSNHSYDVRARFEFVFTLPDTTACSAVSGPVEFRIYGFSGQCGAIEPASQLSN